VTGASALAALLARPIAHRGLHDARLGRVENSLEAAEAAIACGYGIECDVQVTRDGEAMVFHDDTLDRLSEATGPVAAWTAADLARIPLRGGAVIPTLAAFLGRIGGRVPVVIEIKSRFDGDLRLADRVVTLVAGYESVAIESFDPALVARCRTLGATQPLGLVGPLNSGPLNTAASNTAASNTNALDTPAEASPSRGAYDFLSWAIADLAALRADHPTMPLTTWTIRSRDQAALARHLDAQIVFEQFTPD
jgi:glycerophosphoryl diester phosphodiesterase